MGETLFQSEKRGTSAFTKPNHKNSAMENGYRGLTYRDTIVGQQ
jgi:hypothetical protein